MYNTCNRNPNAFMWKRINIMNYIEFSKSNLSTHTPQNQGRLIDIANRFLPMLPSDHNWDKYQLIGQLASKWNPRAKLGKLIDILKMNDQDFYCASITIIQRQAVKPYKKADKEFPSCGNDDQCKCIADLVFRAQHEIDMVDEGQDTPITNKDYNQCKKFVTKWNKPEFNIF